MTTTVTQEQGYAGLAIKIPRVITTSTLAQVTTAGWWNNNPVSTNGQPGLNPQDLICICYAFGSTSESTAFFNVAISGTGVVTLSLAESSVILPVVSGHFANFSGTSGAIADDGYLPSNAAKTRVVMANGATIANHIATYTDTTGTIGEDAGTAINGGNIQAGLSGTAGTLASFPATASNGSFIFAAINNSGGFASTLSNSNIGQATVYSFPDPGAATANVILSTSGSAQTIAGGLTISTGNLGVTVGNVTAGSSGHAGLFTSFPGTASNGSFVFKAINNAGGFVSTLSNSNIAQATVYSLPDTTTATANILASGAALVSGNVVKASGTAGAVVDAGFALHAGTTAAYAGGGTSNAFVTTNMTAASIVTATILTQTNTATIVKAVPGTNTLTVTFSADPGSNTTINWISTTAVA